MLSKKAELILHPVRIRIIMALEGRELAPRELAEKLGDIPQATLYRHINRLHDGGMIKVVEERQVRSATEYVYAMESENAATLTPEEMNAASVEDQMQIFTLFVSTLLADFGRYLERDDVDWEKDMVGFKQIVLFLSDEELRLLVKGINDLLIPLLENEPREDRRRRLFSTILMPGDD